MRDKAIEQLTETMSDLDSCKLVVTALLKRLSDEDLRRVLFDVDLKETASEWRRYEGTIKRINRMFAQEESLESIAEAVQEAICFHGMTPELQGCLWGLTALEGTEYGTKNEGADDI